MGLRYGTCVDDWYWDDFASMPDFVACLSLIALDAAQRWRCGTVRPRSFVKLQRDFMVEAINLGVLSMRCLMLTPESILVGVPKD